MSLFGDLFGKKNENAGCSCSCGCSETGCAPAAKQPAESAADGKTVVKVLGTGCKKCHALHENALTAAEASEKPVVVEYVTDIAEIAAAGVMSTPALMVDGKVVSTGKVLSAEEVKAFL